MGNAGGEGVGGRDGGGGCGSGDGLGGGGDCGSGDGGSGGGERGIGGGWSGGGGCGESDGDGGGGDDDGTSLLLAMVLMVLEVEGADRHHIAVSVPHTTPKRIASRSWCRAHADGGA